MNNIHTCYIMVKKIITNKYYFYYFDLKEHLPEDLVANCHTSPEQNNWAPLGWQQVENKGRILSSQRWKVQGIRIGRGQQLSAELLPMVRRSEKGKVLREYGKS